MNSKMIAWRRLVLAACAAGLVIVLFVPLWTIDLVAPQYPEGLVLVIFPDGLGGNVEIINGLNHYIGMKTLHTEDFPEFKILPYIISGFAALYILAAIIGNRKFFYIVTVLFLLFGVVAMIDFYRWNYDYGHDLDPNAAIQIPGMAYQPPLIGYKQLLNFSAYSLPAAGGCIFITVGLLSVFITVLEFRKSRIAKNRSLVSFAAVAMLSLFFLSSCSTEPKPIQFGIDGCHFCKMTISDNRFGAELVTKKGKVFKFDDIHCLLAFIKTDAIKTGEVGRMYLVDFSSSKLINAEQAFLLKSEELKSPMGGNVAAFATKESLEQTNNKYSGSVIKWSELTK